MKKIYTLLTAVVMMAVGSVNALADEWSIDFSEIGAKNELADKAGATISAAVANGMGTVTLGEALNSNFGIQTGTSWLYRTAQKALYSANSGGRNFGVFNATKDQLITLDISAAPTPTNATLQSTNGNVRVYKVTADGTVTFNLARYNYIYKISVEDPAAGNVDYTVKYVDEEGNELKNSTTNSAAPGSSITLSEVETGDIWYENVKYVYKSDDSTGKKVAEDGTTVVTVVFKQATSYSVSVVDNFGTTLAQAPVYEGETYNYYFPYYVFNAGKFYKSPSVSEGTISYAQGACKITEDKNITVTYTEEENSNVVFYSEAENIATLIPYEDGYTNIRMSNGKTAYAEADGTVILSLPAGKYTLTAASRSSKTTFSAGSNEILYLESTGSVVEITSEVFTLTEQTDITVTAGDNKNYIDFVIVREIKEASAEMVITEAKYATFCAPFEVAIPTGITAYNANSVSNGEINLVEVPETIPANTPVVLYSESAYSTTISGVAVEGTPTAGLLTGVYEETIVPTGSYVLQSQNDKVAFYLVNSEIKVPANKAYLTAPASSAKAINFPSTTAISAIEALTSGKAEIYSVNGAKQNKLQKGINIVNGVKVMVK